MKTYEIIKTDGTKLPLNAKKPQQPTLEELQAAVGGNIELIRLKGNNEMYVNEEGKLEELPINPQASKLARGFIFNGDCIAGNAVLKTVTKG